MKNIITTLLALVTVNAFATVRTLNNNNPSPGQYTTFNAAMNACISGDTIYVSGSPVSYGDIVIEKSITIIGTGHHPQKQNTLVSTFGIIDFDNGPSSVTFIGLNCGIIRGVLGYGSLIINVTRCSISTMVRVYNFQHINLRNSIVNEIWIDSDLSHCLVENCIISGYIKTYEFNNHIVIKNNVFIGTGNFATSVNSITGTAEIHNNIFYGKLPAVSGSGGSGYGIFTHNISYINTFPDDDGNNIVANPLFVNVPIGTTTFNTAHDYHLQPTSPGVLNLGNDGTERGIYGGSPLYSFSMTGEPAIPQIKTMSMPSSVYSGQSIQVNFSSKTNQ